ALTGVRRLRAFRSLIAEAFLELVERALHVLEAPREVVRLTSELVALLLHLAQAALEILHRLGATDHEIARVGVHQPGRGAGTDDEAEQQGEQESDDDHGSFPFSGRVSARSPAPPRARRRPATRARAARPGARRRPDRPTHGPADSHVAARAPRRR